MKPTLLLTLSATLLACTEYGVVAKDELPPGDTSSEPEPLDPQMVLNAEQFEQTVCVSGDQTLSIGNEGEGTLEIYDLILTGNGWSFDEVPIVPFEIEPAASRDFTLEATHGTANLLILSNDPTSTSKMVPLVSNPDADPVPTIASPAHETIVDVGQDLTLVAQVSDDLDTPEALVLSWVSNLDGNLFTGSPDSSGAMSWTWDSSARTEGPHQIELFATDTCGNSASTDIQICQQAGYTVDELDISSWHFEGVANWDTQNSWLELTPVQTWAVGSAFQTSQTVAGDAVSIEFLFYIGDGSGADGISLTALDTTRMTSYLGSVGCGIGYGGDHSCASDPGLPGWSIEVDTYYNSGLDPTQDDHVMFTFDGDLDDPAAWAILPEMEDTGWHTMKVDVVAPHVTVEIDGVVYIDADLNGGSFNFPAYIGFTAGTGSLSNAHLIDSLQVTETICEE
jgi:hypothetical protein